MPPRTCRCWRLQGRLELIVGHRTARRIELLIIESIETYDFLVLKIWRTSRPERRGEMSNRIDRVVMTGGSSGIGLDLARRFLVEGSCVVINGRDPEKLERARRSLGNEQRVIAVAGHVGESATARAVVGAALEHVGGVDVLVNNAGIFAPKPFLDSTEADLEAFFTTNVKGTYLMRQAAVPLMIADGRGAIHQHRDGTGPPRHDQPSRHSGDVEPGRRARVHRVRRWRIRAWTLRCACFNDAFDTIAIATSVALGSPLHAISDQRHNQYDLEER